jgi:anti-sigma factor RsiW
MLRRTQPAAHSLDMNTEHISDHDLERYYLGMITDDDELERLEEHLLCCPPCVERAEETQDYVDAMRVALYDYV